MESNKTKELLKDMKKLKKSDKKPKRKKNILNIFMGIIFIINILLGIGYLGYNIMYTGDKTNQIYLIINSALVTILIILFMITMFMDSDKTKKIMATLTSLFFISFIGFNFLVTTNSINLPTQAVLENFTNSNISDVMKWASSNNIEVEQVYEYSDNVEEFHIISQSVVPNTLLKEVKKIKFTISSGPNYDKLVVISNMVGWNIDEALKKINENFLNNVKVEYIFDDEIEKDVIIEQNVKGQIRRSDSLTLKISLGKKEDLIPTEMINLKNQKLFDATLWLKRNGIPYKLEYEFSNDISRDYVISQSDKEGTMIDQSKNTITLIVSKGKEIIVPNIKEMSVDELTKWVIDNKLKISFDEIYDNEFELGKIINSNYKSGDAIEEGANIKVTVSKGKLKMEHFETITEFRSWANSFDIKYSEEAVFDDKDPGKIVNTSLKEGEYVKFDEEIKVTYSKGKAVTIPNYYNKSKTYIRNSCSSIGLSCTFYYGSNSSSISKDYALSQNKRSGSQVPKGSSLVIYLSKGPATVYTNVVIQGSWWDSSISSSTAAINMLKSKLSQYKGVNFVISAKAGGPRSGLLHPDSPIKGDVSYNFTEGKTYYIWVSQ